MFLLPKATGSQRKHTPGQREREREKRDRNNKQHNRNNNKCNKHKRTQASRCSAVTQATEGNNTERQKHGPKRKRTDPIARRKPEQPHHRGRGRTNPDPPQTHARPHRNAEGRENRGARDRVQHNPRMQYNRRGPQQADSSTTET